MNKLPVLQDIITWHRPAEKHPQPDLIVVATISGKAEGIKFDHTLATLMWSEDCGWYSLDWDYEYLIVHAWCDLEPFKGE